MSETTNAIDPSTETPLHPFDILATLIIAFLAPIFLGVSGGDVGLARLAAIETLNAYRARNNADLIAVAQIAAFGFAALGSLSQSMADSISVSMALRLRVNAVACSRAAEQNRRARAGNPVNNRLSEQQRQKATESEAASSLPEHTAHPDACRTAVADQPLAAEAPAPLEPSPVAPPVSTTPGTAAEKRHQEMWAIAMVKEASEIHASLPDLSPAERKIAAMRAALLSSSAHDLIYGGPAPPLEPGALTSPGTGGRQPPLSASSA
jgi:hypothetical protein